MKWCDAIVKIKGVISLLLLPLLSSCISDDLSVEGDNGNGEMAVGARYVNYAAFKLNSSDGGTIATNWDSNDDKATSTLDKGTGFERMLYFPEPPETNEGEEENENPDNTAAADLEEGDDEEKSDSQLYHFAIIFDAEGNKMTDLLPLDLEFSSDDKPYVTVYSKIYTIEENPFGNKFDGNVLVVFNASYSLQQKIEKDLATNSNLQKFLAYPLEKGLSNDIDNFLYLKDKEDKYITDDSGNRYFTMTSSMVIKEGKLVPAMTGDFKVFSTEEKARKNPTSLYIERLASKFTVVFKNGSKYYYLNKLERANSGESSEEQSYALAGIGTGTKQDPEGVDHLLINITNPSRQLKIVEEYERNTSIDPRNAPDIKDSQSWTVNILGWDINGIEQKENLFKYLNPANSSKYYNGWEDSDLEIRKTRNYWAEDIYYNSGAYPHQTRRAYDGFQSYKDNEGHSIISGIPTRSVFSYESMSPTLNYSNFLQLTKRNIRQYVSENTFSGNLLLQQGQDPYYDQVYLRLGSHLVITAQLLIKELDGDYIFSNENYDSNGMLLAQGNTPAASKYFMNGIFWSEQAFKEYVAEYLAYFMQTSANQNDSKFGRNDGNFYVDKNGVMTLAKGSDFVIEHAYVKGGDNFVYITPADGVVLYTFDPEEANSAAPEISTDPDNNEGLETITRDMETDGRISIPSGYHEISTLNYLNLVYEHRELMAAHYNAGRMYYVKGSVHNKDSENFTKDLLRVSEGDYATVRNNWYAFNVENIFHPGVGVDIETQVIVPNNCNDKSIAVDFKILSWHEKYTSVNTGSQNRPQ